MNTCPTCRWRDSLCKAQKTWNHNSYTITLEGKVAHSHLERSQVPSLVLESFFLFCFGNLQNNWGTTVLWELVFHTAKKLHHLHSKHLSCMKINGRKTCLTFPESFLRFLWSSVSAKISSVDVSLPLTEPQTLFLFCARAEIFAPISSTQRHNQSLLFWQNSITVKTFH